MDRLLGMILMPETAGAVETMPTPVRTAFAMVLSMVVPMVLVSVVYSKHI